MVPDMVTPKERIRRWETDLRLDLESAAGLVDRKEAAEPLSALIGEIIVGCSRLRTAPGGGRTRKSLLDAAEARLSGISWSRSLQREFRKRIRERRDRVAASIDAFEKGLELSSEEDLVPIASDLLYCRDWLSRISAWAWDHGIDWAGLPKWDWYPFDHRILACLPDVDDLLGPHRAFFGKSKESPWIWWQREGCIPSGRIAECLNGRKSTDSAVLEHIRNCPDCSSIADSMRLPRISAAAAREALKASHPSRSTLERYKSLNLATPDWHIVDVHLRKCGACSAAVSGKIGARFRAAVQSIRISISKMFGISVAGPVPPENFFPAWAAGVVRGDESRGGGKGATRTLWKGKSSSAMLHVIRGQAEIEVRLPRPGALTVVRIENAEGRKIPFRRVPAPGKMQWRLSFAWATKDLPIVVRLSLPEERGERTIEIGG